MYHRMESTSRSGLTQFFLFCLFVLSWFCTLWIKWCVILYSKLIVHRKSETLVIAAYGVSYLVVDEPQSRSQLVVTLLECDTYDHVHISPNLLHSPSPPSNVDVPDKCSFYSFALILTSRNQHWRRRGNRGASVSRIVTAIAATKLYSSLFSCCSCWEQCFNFSLSW